MPKLNFSREGMQVECEKGANLREVAIANGIELYPGMTRYFNCHGKGLCGECRVFIKNGMEHTSPKGVVEKFRIGVSWFKFGHESEVRLACQTRVEGDIDVHTQPGFNWFGTAF